MKHYLREPINSITHLLGAFLSIIGTIVLLTHTTLPLNPVVITSILIFGISLVLLYTASGVYHLVYATDAILLRLRKLDHSMIFILIAGSYTPFCLLALDGFWKWFIIITVWSLALIGIILKMVWMNMPRWLSTGFYIGMGWIALFALKPLYASLSLGGFCYLILGGVMYTIGGIIYGTKKPNLSADFGFHEIFHIFVMLGSFCHYWAILNYVI